MSTPLLEVRGLRVHYGAGKNPLKAVDNVSLTVNRGECVGLVGESGCGKSTLGRAVLRLEKWAGGDVLFDGVSVGKLGGTKLKAYRKRAQMVFQDPYGSLNPRISIGGALEEVLKVHGEKNPAARHARIGSLLLEVGLRPEFASRYPHEFSGGQRQRIGIARALAVDPELIIADEPVSALDVSVQVQVLNLLRDIQQRKGIAMLFVAHDLAVVRYISQRVVVMYLGRVMETGSAEHLYNAPAHPYTAKLLAAVPDVEKGLRKRVEEDVMEKPSETAASRPERGCQFAPRCPLVELACRDSAPELRPAGPERLAACRRLEVQLASRDA